MSKNYRDRKFLLIFQDLKDISFLKTLKSPPKKYLLDVTHNNVVYIGFENQRWFKSLCRRLKKSNLKLIHKSRIDDELLRCMDTLDPDIVPQDPQGSQGSQSVANDNFDLEPCPRKMRCLRLNPQVENPLPKDLKKEVEVLVAKKSELVQEKGELIQEKDELLRKAVEQENDLRITIESLKSDVEVLTAKESQLKQEKDELSRKAAEQEIQLRLQSTSTEDLKKEVEAVRKQAMDQNKENEQRISALTQMCNRLFTIISDDENISSEGSRYLGLRILGFQGHEKDEDIEKQYALTSKKLLALTHPDKVDDQIIRKINGTYFRKVSSLKEIWTEHFQFQSFWKTFNKLSTQYKDLFGEEWSPKNETFPAPTEMRSLKWNIEMIKDKIYEKLFARYNALCRDYELENEGQSWEPEVPDIYTPEKLDALKDEIERLEDALGKVLVVTVD